MTRGSTEHAGPGRLEVIDPIEADLAAKPDGVLESVAERHGVPLAVVLDRLPSGQCVTLPGALFREIWTELTAWGAVLLLLHTQDGVFEIRTPLPPGTDGQGSFNVHGEGPFGGHLRPERCASVRLVDRPFFGRRSCSVQFINGHGACMFKVFVARDESRSLHPDQVRRFEALKGWAS